MTTTAPSIGDAVVFSCTFLNASGVAAAPTTTQLFVTEADGTELYWDKVPTTPAGMNALSGTTTVTMTFVCRKPERLTGHWVGAGNGVNQTKQETFFVKHSTISSIDP